MGSRLGGGGDDDVMADINITPFVDIILVVLIIFMVTTASIVESDSIKVNLPEAASGEATETTSLGLTLTADGGLSLDGELLSLEQLKVKLKAAKAESDDVVCLIAADKAVAHGRVVWLIDVVKTAGITKFAINIDKADAIPPDPATIGEGVAPVPEPSP